MYRLDRKMAINVISAFLFGYNMVVYALDPNNSVVRGCGVL